jgi:hypothetical protein
LKELDKMFKYNSRDIKDILTIYDSAISNKWVGGNLPPELTEEKF